MAFLQKTVNLDQLSEKKRFRLKNMLQSFGKVKEWIKRRG